MHAFVLPFFQKLKKKNERLLRKQVFYKFIIVKYRICRKPYISCIIFQ